MPQKIKAVNKFGYGCLLSGHLPILSSEYKYMRDITVAPNQAMMAGASLLVSSPFLRAEYAGEPREDQGIIRGWRFQGAYKFFLGKYIYAPEGWYAGPYVSYAESRFSTRALMPKKVYIKITQLNVLAMAGYQSLIGSKATWDLYVAMGYKHNEVIEPQGVTGNVTTFKETFPNFFSDFRFTMGLNLGIASFYQR